MNYLLASISTMVIVHDHTLHYDAILAALLSTIHNSVSHVTSCGVVAAVGPFLLFDCFLDI